MVQYINKDALVAKIRGYINNAEVYLKYHHNRNDKSVYAFEQEKLVMCELLSSLDNLEVKEEPVSEIDFEQELYKYFGQVKDFTLGMRIAKRFYEIGRNHQEPVSEDLEKAAKQYSFYIPTQCEATETWKKETEQHFIDGAKWKLAKNKSITLDNLDKFINELSKQFPEVSFAKVCKIATRTAKWLKQQMMKDETQNL
jgi:hypothetical protein